MIRQLIPEIVCLFAALFVQDSFVFANGSEPKTCETPDHWEGECIDILKCPSLLALADNASKSEMETTFLKQSQCGRADLTIYVCCRFENINLLPNTRHCGQSFANRIVGGTATHIDEYPWTVLILFETANNTYYLCGGALINNRYVLTAAHCSLFEESNVNDTPIRLGEWNVDTNPDCETIGNGAQDCADPHLDVGIEEFIRHPNFTFEANAPIHDIALIRLDRYVNFTDFIQPVCLPVQPRLRSETYVGVSTDIVGWGSTGTSDYSIVKQKAFVNGINLDVCRQKYSNVSIRILDSHVCAGGAGGVDTCRGDSGGQLVSQQRVDFRNVYVLTGVSSFSGKPCGLRGWPGVYTRVGAYMDWIRDTLRP